MHKRTGEYFLKRPLDVVLSALGILLSSPLWLVISIAIWVEDGGPVFYRQARKGRKGKIFDVLKIRSMIVDAEKLTGAVWAGENDPRVTRVGRILRSTAMDELPQLLNILKGDMSFVGPRPERPELVMKFNGSIPNFDRRNLLRPGLTGLAQIYGQYDTPPKHKLKYDLLYVKKQGLLLDMKLILLSFWITLIGRWEARGKKFGFRGRLLKG